MKRPGRICWALLLACLLPQMLVAQMRIGEWRTHFSYASVDKVLHTPQAVYALSNGHLFSYDSQDGVIQTYSVLNALNGNHVAQMAYNQATHTLLLVYSDGNMDLCSADGDVFNLSDYRDKAIAADKSVNRVRMNGKYAYLATNIGFLQVDMQRQEISESYMFRQEDGSYLQVKDVLPTDTCFYISTQQGMYRGYRQDNLLDFSYWHPLKMYVAPVPDALLDWNGEMLVSTGMKIYRYYPENQTWELRFQYYSEIDDLFADDGFLVVQRPGFVRGIHRPDGSLLQYAFDGKISADYFENATVSFDKELMYAASGDKGLTIWQYDENQNAYVCVENDIKPNGPNSQTAWKMFVQNDKLYATGGGRWGDRYRWKGAVFAYQDGEWISLVEDNASLKAKLGFDFQDVVSMAVDPADESHLYVCTWGDGLMEFRNGTLQTCHTWNNSPLVTMFPDAQPERYVRVDGAQFDAAGNFWLLNSDVVNGKGAIHIIRPDGSWFSPKYSNFDGMAPSWDDILFASNGLVWMNSERINTGLFVLDTNGTLEDTSDDKTRWISQFFDQDGNAMKTNTLHCMAEDRDGTIWVGSTYGPLLISGSHSVFDVSMPQFTRIKVPRNDGTQEADYLLNASMIYDIAVDAANRKWLATNNDGVYLLSPDGLQTIHHFTTENSPLPSNVIYSVEVHPQTGEVFIGSEAGFVSYRSDAVQAEASFSSVSVYPNPVRPEFVGDVVVQGLMEDSQVKITDMHGRLLASGRSLGGQFLWDLCHPDGQRVSSGVYLVYAADENGESGVVAKIVVVK
ncbi:MAG: hypothetical protein J6R21_03045 [Bacteroidales bacterium]|nr:hypothetical protein [Bacteroidales bacterium]